MENSTINEEKIEIKQNELIDFVDKDEKKNIDTKKEKHKKEKNNKKIIMISIILAIIAVFAILFSTIFSLININNKDIVSGVKIEGIDVSRLSKEEALKKLEEIYNEKINQDILLKYEDYDATIIPELLETKYEIEEAVNNAVNLGKDSNIIINNYNIFLALIGQKNINVKVSINEEESKKIIEDIGTNIPGAMIENSYSIEGEKLIITKGKEGLKIDTNKLLNQIKNNLENITITQQVIEIPVINESPDKINIEEIYKEVYKEVKDAYYTKDPFTIHPEVEGIDFDIEEAKKILEEDKEQYEITLTITKPKITTSQIGSEAFPDLLGTFTTRYDASLKNRTTNLVIACQKINDKVILPGEIFSYNKALGERTAAAGYKNAAVYENGQVVDGIGGGICQISSTLYNAVLLANLETTERRNHMFVTSYTPEGRDATVVYGITDYKFKNTRNYAIKIKASCSNGIAKVSIYGIKEENEYSITFRTKTISTIPYTVKYVDDNSLKAGQEKVKQKGANGLITETYIIKSLNGKVVSTELLSKDTYNAMQKIILRGTKGEVTNKENTNNNNEKPNTNINENSGKPNENITNNTIENTTVTTNTILNITENTNIENNIN